MQFHNKRKQHNFWGKKISKNERGNVQDFNFFALVRLEKLLAFGKYCISHCVPRPTVSSWNVE